MHASGPSRYLVDAFCQATDLFPGHLNLCWISGHGNVTGNERADELAKSAAQGHSSLAADLLPILC